MLEEILSEQAGGERTGKSTSLQVQPASVIQMGQATFGFARQNGETRLVILTSDSEILVRFQGDSSAYGDRTLLIGATNAHNAAALRQLFPWLKPKTLGLQTSAGFGDRLGLATPGHIHALRSVGGGIAPIFAQQSIREMTRTNRRAQEVLDDAMWGVFAEGWQDGFGADADHLKTPADIDSCVAAAFTFYTIDPGEYVDDHSIRAGEQAIKQAFAALPWDRLEDSGDALRKRYLSDSFELETGALAFDETTLTRGAVKYGKVVAHVAMMYRHLMDVSGGTGVEMEISVDETESVTTHAEHLYIANELKRLGVQWVSLAPRYVGRFEKGVDYIGDLAAFEADFALHAEIARRFGPYKMSLHSGSDKFSVYPIAARQTRGLVHLKTAGTSYLEALRAVATLDPALFREIYGFARERYDTDRASYHVSAEVSKAPSPDSLNDAELPTLLDQFDARQILHVTFGSALTARDDKGQFRFKDKMLAVLKAHPDVYTRDLEKHFVRHLRPFAH
ncbi:MAG: tagaturonate epimerase family protein [Aggregatilineales bacterium]